METNENVALNKYVNKRKKDKFYRFLFYNFV